MVRLLATLTALALTACPAKLPGGKRDAGSKSDAGTEDGGGWVEEVVPADGGSTEVIPPGRRTVWSPGIPGGIPARATVCATLDAATYGDDQTDAFAAIQAALDACPEGQVVYLPPGTYRISDTVQLAKGVVLRGAGPGKTRIWYTGTSNALGIAEMWPQYADPVDVTADAPKGAKSIPVADASSFRVGDVITLDQLDDSYVFLGGCVWFKRGPVQANDRRPLSPEGYRSQGQMLEVVSISGNVLTVDRPIHLGFRQALRPQVYKSTTRVVKYAGIEDLTVTGSKGGTPLIYLLNAAYSWVKNVEGDGSTTTGNGLVGDHVTLESTYRCVVRDSYFHDATDVVQGGGAYGIRIASQASENLVENNIVVNLNKPMTTQASGGGNVVAYNYVDDAWTAVAPNLQETTIDAGHASFPYMELFEGNWAAHMGTDLVWGNSGWITFFRNYASAQQRRTPVIPEDWDVAAIGLEGKAHFINVVGNVLGYPGKWLEYEVASNPPGTAQAAIYRIGHRADGDDGAGDPDVYEDPTQAGTTMSTLLRHGNFDYATGSVIWHPLISAQTLPNSLYLTAKPEFFGSNPWPWVEPLGQIKTLVLPAKARYDAIPKP